MASRARVTLTVVILLVMVIPGNLLGAQYGLYGQQVALVSIESVSLLMAFWGIHYDHLYSGRLVVTKRKTLVAFVTGVIVMLAVLFILNTLKPLAVQQTLSPLLHQPHPLYAIIFANGIPVLLVPIAEELLFHGYLFEYASKRLTGRLGFIVSVIIVGSLFGFSHTVHDIEQMLFRHLEFANEMKLFAFQWAWGVLGCVLYAYSRNLMYLIVIHALLDSSFGLPLLSHPNYIGLFLVLSFIALPMVKKMSQTRTSQCARLDESVT